MFLVMTVVATKQMPERRTQQQRREATTAAVLDAAASAVVETGPATGLAEIARRAGVTKGALQHHFANKHDLLTAVVSAGWHDLIERLEALAVGSKTPADRIRSLVDEMWASYQQPMCRAAFMISSDPNIDDELAVRLSPLFQATRAHLDQLWSESFSDLGVPNERLVSARRFVRSHLLGMLVQRQLRSVEPDPVAELSMLSAMTLQVLLAAEAS